MVVVAGATLRRARKRDLQIQFGAGDLGGVTDNINEIVDSGPQAEKRTGTAPHTIL